MGFIRVWRNGGQAGGQGQSSLPLVRRGGGRQSHTEVRETKTLNSTSSALRLMDILMIKYNLHLKPAISQKLSQSP